MIPDLKALCHPSIELLVRSTLDLARVNIPNSNRKGWYSSTLVYNSLADIIRFKIFSYLFTRFRKISHQYCEAAKPSMLPLLDFRISITTFGVAMEIVENINKTNLFRKHNNNRLGVVVLFIEIQYQCYEINPEM